VYGVKQGHITGVPCALISRAAIAILKTLPSLAIEITDTADWKLDGTGINQLCMYVQCTAPPPVGSRRESPPIDKARRKQAREVETEMATTSRCTHEILQL
jgi:hypothetical protein